MNNEPITKVYLLDVPIDDKYINTLYFNNKDEQQAYFQSKIIKSYTNFTYQRKDNVIRIPDIFDNIYNANYVMYQNSNYNNKWFYAFIKDLEYSNDELTIATIETDVIQTWLFDYQFKPSFIEREHTNNDTIGSNTVPENLETGEYVNIGFTGVNYGGYYTCIGVSENLFEEESAPVKVYNGISSGLTYIILKTYTDVNRAVQLYQGKSDALYCMFMIPKNFFTNGLNWKQWTFHFGDINVTIDYAYAGSSSLAYPIDTTTFSINNKLGNANGYVPKNQKLFTYPYNFIRADNNAGTNAIYHYELFDDIHNIEFMTGGNICCGCSIKCFPKHYKNINMNYGEGFTGAKLPVCSWVTDPYVNWLTQNSINMESNVVKSSLGGIAGGMLAGMVKGGTVGGAYGMVGGAIVGGLGAVYNNVVESASHDLAPLQSRGNTNASDVNFSLLQITPIFYKVSIKEEYARIIDEYFQMYGYKTNRVKIPYKNHRSKWWYTKTVDANIVGGIPEKDMNKIKDAYNNGITFWKNANEIGDYSLNNSII